ncbi:MULTISPECIES: hypothetical protein [Vibrio]|uniref:hypothetical protein n=1 Tax=Vibrio TaxID=662 RepID=UPI001122F86F|nr:MULTISPECIES: hypothetical protein [Vibrio]ELA9459139.1 hypothetical protein [Vibrio alginolyticus]MBS9846561.1 hypothetical protein [Vibrio alginolyticus]MDW1637187.1 hypothetical protein [Vibrio sp. Vb2907]MDW1707960.1 hypothetical protein [Vibrio sp. Vb2917]MDW1722499.1 hypothetical protein [Vibrio sp. Vb2979]
MAWTEEYIRDYTKERDELFKERWFTAKSWFARSKESTKYHELENLLSIEKEFNSRWVKHVRHAVVKYKLKADDIAEAKLLIDTHISKHKERDFFLIIVGVLFAASMKALGSDVLFSSAIVLTALFLGYERLFGSTTKNSLEEFKAILDIASPPKT